MRYFLHIAYNGNNYRGWQKLPGIISVQQVVETTLSQILKEDVSIVGCGRTDAQVHASQFFFHFDVGRELNFDLLYRLNKCLPHDITVFDVMPMEGLPHARFDAIQRSYDYYIHTQKDPYLVGLSSFYPLANPDLNNMKEAVGLLTNYDDYRCFCKSPLKYEYTICNVSKAQLFSDIHHTRLRFHVSSNRFLAGMIRIIVGKLLEIGNGELTVTGFEQFLKSKETPKSIVPVYAQGLYLTKVTYPYLNLPSKSIFGRILENEVDIPV
ncbi:MAG: tRNA pseudouridine synthase A [Bacteroidia bacterium]|nr:tRNA pseudouridine synthase A [Bacteroidia bacterium]